MAPNITERQAMISPLMKTNNFVCSVLAQRSKPETNQPSKSNFNLLEMKGTEEFNQQML